MMPNQPTTQDPSVREQLDNVLAFFRRAARFWRILLVTVVLGGVAFGVFSYLKQPTFRSETVILYVEKGGPNADTESSEAQRTVTTRLKELLFSRPNLERVVTAFGLYPEVRRKFGMVDAIEELKKHIDFRAPGGDTFSIAFEGRSPDEVQRVTAELSRLVIDGDAELRKGQAQVALDFLVGERKTREAELRSSEEKLASFMAQHPRFALDATPLANGAAIRASMGGVAGAPGAGRFMPAPRASWGAGTAPKSSSPQGTPLATAPAPGGKADSEESRARAALAAARESLTDKLAHYTPAHPDVRAAEAAVQRATERLAAASSNAAAAPKPMAEAPPAAAPAASGTTPPTPAAHTFAARPPSPQPVAGAAADRAQNLVELETQWLKLTRAVTEARQRLDQIEAQLFRADIQVSSETGGHGVQVNVIDPAFRPQRPLPPGRLTLAAIFLAASLTLGAIGALIMAAFDERLFTARDLAGITEVLTEVPKGTGRKAYVAS
jgi:hypothetical protein